MKYLWIFIAIIATISCSSGDESYTIEEGIKIFRNSSKNKLKNYAFNLTTDMIIGESDNLDATFISVSDIDIDNNGDIYIFDNEGCKILRYDRSGNLLNTIGNKGEGPGEFWLAGAMVIKGDTVVVSDWRHRQLIKFRKDGEFIDNKIFGNTQKYPAYIHDVNDTLFYNSSTSNQISETTKEMCIVAEISFFDKNLDHSFTIFEKEIPMSDYENGDPTMLQNLVRCSRNRIYLYKASKDRYLLDVFNLEGDKIEEIRRSYLKVKFPSEEKEKMVNEGKKYGLNYQVEYKPSVEDIRVEKGNRLLVKPASSSDNNRYDIYEDGILKGTAILEIEKPYNFHGFIEDKAIFVDRENMKVKICSYDLK